MSDIFHDTNSMLADYLADMLHKTDLWNKSTIFINVQSLLWTSSQSVAPNEWRIRSSSKASTGSFKKVSSDNKTSQSQKFS